ncbi:hypothetical protein PROFUN_09317 [Planoprotostelium fungivorum]|uniref:Uncharacterized protein n=1 Tax=Planoprotostelium fungivorum TaxID=1890364 RepID=A0A2P6NH93_9EUKA|nr:hypothetical protein PROFUN_09317 [Planoprotostelium fungivorum]
MIGKILTFPIRHWILTPVVAGAAYLYYTSEVNQVKEIDGHKVKITKEANSFESHTKVK